MFYYYLIQNSIVPTLIHSIYSISFTISAKTPLIKLGEESSLNVLERSTASLIETLYGISSLYRISYIESLRIAKSTLLILSKFQSLRWAFIFSSISPITTVKASLITHKYIDYMSHLSVSDLTNLKFYVSNKVNVENKDNLSGTIKILRIISRLLKEKETHKLNFNE